ncbi:MAG TPA: CDP-alcohol phosphatidyltransferase family protein [Beijerinckiaceae bacterium]|nr:CDP-alcohol phosphatidyltransferase family protein [Beijerinckiaceae bacterium]
MAKRVDSALFRSLPNLITLGRLVLVPAVIAMIASNEWSGAFAGFLVAGISDGVDGWLAKRFNLRTELGAYLDPLADKALLISIYVALAWVQVVPVSLAVLVVFRDVMIIGAVIVSWVLRNPVEIRPLFISKANTALQIVFAAGVLAAKSFSLTLGPWFGDCVYVVAALTLASAAAYLSQWLKHMSL